MKKTISYVLRDIDRDFWLKIKYAAYKEQLTIQEYILLVLAREMALEGVTPEERAALLSYKEEK